MSRKRPLITSPKDIIIYDRSVANDSSGPEPEEGTIIFHVTPDEKVYHGISSTPPDEITLEECAAPLLRIPDRFIYPSIHKKETKLTLLHFQEKNDEFADSTKYFIKRPRMKSFNERTQNVCPDYLAFNMLREIESLEEISKKPHPFIVKYHGCRARRGRIVGIVLDRAEISLWDAVHDPRFKNLDPVRFWEALMSAVLYLHSLGLAHNDLNPSNIMLSKDGQPVLIDFDSCERVGRKIDKWGTEGWTDPDERMVTSERRHDLYALSRLKIFLDRKFGKKK